MQVEAELSSLHKKLVGNWSAWTVSQSMSKKIFIDEVIRSFDNFEKKVKMKILISLLGIESSKKSECMPSVIKLLELACSDKSDLWISITAGLVHKKLFENRSTDLIEQHANTKITETIEMIMNKLDTLSYNNTTNNKEVVVNGDESDINKYVQMELFQPYEYQYLSPSLISNSFHLIDSNTTATTTNSSSSNGSSSSIHKGLKTDKMDIQNKDKDEKIDKNMEDDEFDSGDFDDLFEEIDHLHTNIISYKTPTTKTTTSLSSSSNYNKNNNNNNNTTTTTILSSSIQSTHIPHTTTNNNPHFTYIGNMPDFLNRDRENMGIKKPTTTTTTSSTTTGTNTITSTNATATTSNIITPIPTPIKSQIVPSSSSSSASSSSSMFRSSSTHKKHIFTTSSGSGSGSGNITSNATTTTTNTSNTSSMSTNLGAKQYQHNVLPNESQGTTMIMSFDKLKELQRKKAEKGDKIITLKPNATVTTTTTITTTKNKNKVTKNKLKTENDSQDLEEKDSNIGAELSQQSQLSIESIDPHNQNFLHTTETDMVLSENIFDESAMPYSQESALPYSQESALSHS